jgi:hypothetical protein
VKYMCDKISIGKVKAIRNNYNADLELVGARI